MKRLSMSLSGAALLAVIAACGQEPANDQVPAAEQPAANDAAILNDAAPDPAATPPAPPEPDARPKPKAPKSEPKVIIDPPPPDPHAGHDMANMANAQ